MNPPIKTFQKTDMDTRFWRFIEKGPRCWLWTGSRDAEPNDYGQFYDSTVKRARRSHVVMWELVHGKKVPKGKVVRHSCDTPACVKPQHLILGGQNDNVRDMVSRGRQARGSKSGMSKLNEATVLAIRADYDAGAQQKDLAERYGVIQQNISLIVRRKTWTHI